MFACLTSAFVLVYVHAVRTLAHQPECVSPFDNTYKIIEKLVDINNKMQEMKQQLDRQRSAIAVLEKEVRTSGDTYIRWGRKACNNNGTMLIYPGFMAGSDKTMPGTGSNYLCLAGDPTWDHYDASMESLGKITGTEYRFYNHRSNGAADFLGENMYNQNAPCALCHTQRSTVAMIPGRTNCYDGWTEEYRGFLVSGYTADASATEYVCIDRRPEKVVNGEAEDNDNRLYFVEAICGKSLACPPYIAGREIACVVCSI